MTGIEFIDTRGRKGELSQAPGGGNSYHLTLNDYYYGCIVKYNPGGWTACPNNKELPDMYWAKLVKWVEDNEKEK